MKTVGQKFNWPQKFPLTECLLKLPWGKVRVQDGVPLRRRVDKELVNGHPQEVTFQGGYYVVQSLTKQWQDPRIVGKEPLLSQGQPKSRRLQTGRALVGSFSPSHSLLWGNGKRGLDERSCPSAPHEGGGGLARIWRKSAHPCWGGREKQDSEGFYHE